MKQDRKHDESILQVFKTNSILIYWTIFSNLLDLKYQVKQFYCINNLQVTITYHNQNLTDQITSTFFPQHYQNINQYFSNQPFDTGLLLQQSNLYAETAYKISIFGNEIQIYNLITSLRMKQRLLIADLSQVELIKEQETIKDSQMEVQESIEIHLGYNISQIDSSKQLLIQSAFILIYYILNSLQSHNQKLCKICLYNISVDKLSCLRGQTLLEMEMFSFEQQAICLYLDWNL